MTAAVIAQEEEADWAVVWRLVNRQPVGQSPTEEETRVAAWLLLDLGHDRGLIMEWLGLSRARMAAIYDLRALAIDPQRLRGPNDKRRLVDPATFAPTAWHRTLTGVPFGVVRPGSAEQMYAEFAP